MKTFTLVSAFALVAVCSSVNFNSAYHWSNGQRQEYSDDLPWIMLTSDDGTPTLAILKGPKVDNSPKDLATDVRFWLYTKQNPTSGYRLHVGDAANLAASNFNSANPTKFLTHGFTNNIDSPIIQDLKTAYLAVGSYNVIGVDWGDLAQGPLYNVAQANTYPVGQYVGLMVDHLVSSGGSTYGRIHLVGHSLGAHVSGIAGDSATGTVGRVTGLDAALPLFPNEANSHRLDPSDAAFVDSIHTCGGWLGFNDPVAHADFYPNGGQSSQPGCGADLTGSCSHGRAYEFFEQSIRNNNAFPAHACSTLDDAHAGTCASGTNGVMGEGAGSGLRGLFYMATA